MNGFGENCNRAWPGPGETQHKYLETISSIATSARTLDLTRLPPTFLTQWGRIKYWRCWEWDLSFHLWKRNSLFQNIQNSHRFLKTSFLPSVHLGRILKISRAPYTYDPFKPNPGHKVQWRLAVEVILCGAGDGRRDSCARYCYPREGRSYSRLSPSSGHGPGYTPGNSNDISPPPAPGQDCQRLNK